MMERDPRVTPAAGDKVSKGKLFREVVDVKFGANVYYRRRENGPVCNCWITTWQEWCKGATVIH